VFDGDDNATIYYLPAYAAEWPSTFGDRPTAPWPLPAADITQDGEVNLTDFALFTDQWLEPDCGQPNNWCQYSDFDQSGTVDILDLAAFAQSWLYPN